MDGPESSGIPSFDWILDDNLLRDEGIIYGISGSDHSEKVATIDFFYQKKIAVLETERQQSENQILDGHERIRRLEEKINEMKLLIEEWTLDASRKEHLFFRALAGFLAYSGIIFFTYWAIFEWIGPQWRHSVFITLGSFLFGSLSLFYKNSILYHNDEAATSQPREKWKILMEEYGIPFVSTLFIVIWGAHQHELARTLSFGLLLLALFLFAGKGFLGSIIQLRAETLLLLENTTKHQFKRKKIREAEKEIAEYYREIGEIKQKRIELEMEMVQKEREAAELQQIKETKIQYFLSEMRLAQSARDSYSSEQLLRWGLNQNQKEAHG